ncbi:ABC transporter ATP-binding protein [Roseburia hominis]
MITADKKKGDDTVLSEILLSTKGLTKRYGHHKAVDHVDLHIKRGAIYGFIGRNGAGKTTCLKMISGLAKPTEGEIEMFGYKGKELRQIRSRVGCLIEAPGLYGNMNAYDNLNIKCRLLGIHTPGYVEEILETVGLSDVGKKKTKHYSLGMKQRLGIGLALVGEPDLLVLDEPINGLDPQGIAEVRDTIQKLQKERNMTILISSHILEELSKLATDYGIIHNGSLLQEVTQEELMRRCGERIELTVDRPGEVVPVLDRMGFSEYKVVDKEHIHIYERLNESTTLNMELARAGIPIRGIAVTSEELETYYLNLTGGASHA